MRLLRAVEELVGLVQKVALEGRDRKVVLEDLGQKVLEGLDQSFDLEAG